MANGAANYTEELVAALVTTQLTIMSFPVFDVQIVPFSSNFENLFGADAKIPGSARIAPFYMQFKRPNRSTPTGQISQDRGTFGLSCTTDSLNFRLRKKAVPVRKLQHNVLYRMRDRLLRRGIGDAAYVCSLFLSSRDYVAYTHLHGLLNWPLYWLNGPYTNRDVLIHDAAPVSFAGIPLLYGHVSIPPHDAVMSADHSYSFDHMGGEVCFHSPSIIERDHRTFNDWIVGLRERARSGRAPAYERSGELLADLLEAAELPDQPTSGDGLSAAEWMAFGDALEEQYGISQFAFLVEP